ncbi:von Willebrand factor type A domain-containing protein [Chloroflexota bacterium]
MKTQKFYVFITILSAFSLVLSACGPAAAPANYERPEALEEPALEYESGNMQDEQMESRSDSPPISSGSGSGGESGGGPVIQAEPAEEKAEQDGMGGASVAPNTAPSGGEGQSVAPSGGQPQGQTEVQPHPTQAPFPTQGPPEDPFGDTFFQDYGVNPFIDTEDDHFSTFSLDVDTGSFSIARSYLMDGYMPPEDAIRVEEFINYFPQGYPTPSEHETFGIFVDGAPAPFTETERYQIMRVGVQGFEISAWERKPVSLTFVIDVSGSMHEGGRLELVKDALALLVGQLTHEDRVSIVAYSTEAWVVLQPTRGDRRETILQAIEQLYPMNSTNAEAGLILGYDLATHSYLAGGINRVVLCSDGVANVGNTGPNSIWEQIKYQASEGITLTAIGVGMGNYNDVLLEQLADNGEGFYAYIDTMEEAERLFLRDLVGTLQVIAMDAKIQVEFNPEVVSRYRLVGYENRDIADQDFRNDKVDAGEIGAGHSATALYEVKLHPGAEGRIATIHLRWQDPDTGRVYEISEDFYAYEMAENFEDASPYFQLDVMVAEFAEILRDSYWASSSYEEVLYHTERTARYLENPDVYDLLDMMRQAAWIAGY